MPTWAGRCDAYSRAGQGPRPSTWGGTSLEKSDDLRGRIEVVTRALVKQWEYKLTVAVSPQLDGSAADGLARGSQRNESMRIRSRGRRSRCVLARRGVRGRRQTNSLPSLCRTLWPPAWDTARFEVWDQRIFHCGQGSRLRFAGAQTVMHGMSLPQYSREKLKPPHWQPSQLDHRI
jgi:hypothetical protein